MSEELNEYKLKVGILGRDVENQEKQCSKMTQKVTESIEKLQEVNVNVVRMITIHDLKHEQHDKIEDELKTDVKELHTRITTVNQEMQDRLVKVEENITGRLDDLKNFLVYPKEIEDKKNFLKLFTEKYKYAVLGGFFVIGWILLHIEEVIKIFKLLY